MIFAISVVGIWHTFFYQPLVNLLIFLYQALGGNLGVAIIAATIMIRAALIPMTSPGMKSAQKMQELKPKLDKLKDKHKDDKQALAQAQLDLYKQHGVNPFSGILPMIIQVVVLIALFQAFRNILANGDAISKLNDVLYPFLQLPQGTHLQTSFFYLDVAKPDTFALPFEINLGLFKLSSLPGIFLIGAAVTQFWSSKMMMTTRAVQAAKPDQKKKDGDQADMMQGMQSQMMYMMPVMTLLIGYRFPSGLVLYWLTFSVVMLVQQMWLKKKASQELVGVK